MKKPRLVVFSARGARSFSSKQRRSLRAAAHTTFVLAARTVPQKKFVDLLKNATYAGLTPRATPRLSESLLSRLPRLQGITIPTRGFEWLNTEALRRRRISVATAPDFCSQSAAEFAMGLLISLVRRIPAANNAMKYGRRTNVSFLGTELRGKTLGIVGYGEIGKRVARMGRAFQMRILATDICRFHSSRDVRFRSLHRLLKESDIVSLHLPLNSSTMEMFGSRSLSLMKPGAWLMNVSRPGLVSTKAVLSALKEKRLSGYAVDSGYYSKRKMQKLARHPNVLAVPHISWYTREAVRTEVDVWVEQILRMVRSNRSRAASLHS